MVETNMPVMFLKDNILFPYNDVRVEYFKEHDNMILDVVEKYNDNHVLLINLSDPLDEHPNIKDLPSTQNTIAINGYVFAGGKGDSSTAATIAGTATINVDGSDLPNCSVFGGNDINGTTSGNITVNVGKTYKSTIFGVYGGGNKANINTTTPNVKVYLLANANATNAFKGGRAADLI